MLEAGCAAAAWPAMELPASKTMADTLANIRADMMESPAWLRLSLQVYLCGKPGAVGCDDRRKFEADVSSALYIKVKVGE
jgi:hypothetical protein